MFDSPIFTNKGKQVFYNNLNGQEIRFTKIKLGRGTLNASISGLEDLIDSVAEINASYTVAENGSYADVSGYFKNTEIQSGFYWREIGIFVADNQFPDDRTKDILLCYQNAFDTAEYIATADLGLIEKYITVPVVVGNAENLSCTLSSSLVYISRSEHQADLSLKVDKVQGKGLSTEDFNTVYKAKLDSIEAGATRTVVDSQINMNSNNPVRNSAVATALEKKAGRNVAGEYFTIDGETVKALAGAEIFNDYSYNKATGLNSHAEGKDTAAFGNCSHSEGLNNTAANSASHAEGIFTAARGEASHAEGYTNIASGDSSHAEGYYNTASGENAHAEGQGNTASGKDSHAEGYYCEAKGNYSFAGGAYTKANHFQAVVGKCNEEREGPIDNIDQSATKALFIVGHGKLSTPANALTVYADGKCKGSSAFVSSGADFAEYFEWTDGNPNNEDRRGKLVTLDGDKIRLATADDTYILGVVSTIGAYIGNSASEEWQGKYLKDIFGERIMQEVEVPEKTDERTGKVIPAHTATQFAVNPDYDPDTEYVSREYRREWAAVGLLGQVVVVDDGTCTVGGFCNASENGVGASGNRGYKVLKRIDSTHIKVLVR